jgi:hypothetical protein
MDIIGVPASDFPVMANAVAWHFDSFVDRSHGETDLEHLLMDVMNGERQCWMAWDGRVRACGLTQVLDDGMKVVELTHCAGDGREDWNALLIENLKEWSKHIGAKRFRVINRPGHTKMLKEMGFKETHRILEQDL